MVTNNNTMTVARGETTTLTFNGYNLAGISATVNSTTPDQFTTQVLSSAATQARVQLTVGADAALGDSTLVISSSAGAVSVTLKVIDLSQITLIPEADTRLLWHLDEAGDGSVRVRFGLVFLDGTRRHNSKLQPGRSGLARFAANVILIPTQGCARLPKLQLHAEFWMKSDPVINTTRWSAKTVTTATTTTPTGLSG